MMLARRLHQGCVHLFKSSSFSPLSAEPIDIAAQSLSTTTSLSAVNKYDRRKSAVRQGVSGDEPIQDPTSVTDGSQSGFGRLRVGLFPTQNTATQIFNGIPYNQLPIVHIKATNNNTIISATDSDGDVFALQSAGTVGFRNARRGTNVAAQAAAIALAGDMVRKDIKMARVCLKGIGPGRLPALKALQLSGVDVISITDTTPLPHNGNRPKKVRRL